MNNRPTAEYQRATKNRPEVHSTIFPQSVCRTIDAAKTGDLARIVTFDVAKIQQSTGLLKEKDNATQYRCKMVLGVGGPTAVVLNYNHCGHQHRINQESHERNTKERMVRDVVPGVAGQFRVYYWPDGERELAGRTTDWVVVGADNDFIGQLELASLRPGTKYRYQVESRGPDRAKATGKIDGSFRTAPSAESDKPIRFIVTTCQAVRSIDDEYQPQHTEVLGSVQ